MGLQDLIKKYDNGGFSKTGWFQLKDDGDSAVVRLLHKGEVGTDPSTGEPDYDFPIYEVHKLDVDGSGRDRTVLCKGEGCELCKAGNKPSLRMFLQMVNLDEKDKEKQAQLWERGLTDIKQMIGLTSEYGDLTKRNIKIVRSGAKGSLKTTYQYFPKDPTEMELPEPQNLVGSLILDLDKEDQIKAIEGRLQLNRGNNSDNEGGSGKGGGNQLVEECAELIQAVSKYRRAAAKGEDEKLIALSNLVEEIADVEIMIEQIKHLLQIQDEDILALKQFKINRTKERIDGRG